MRTIAIMRWNAVQLSVLILLSGLVSCASAPVDRSPPLLPQIRTVVLEGSPEAIGRTHGQALGAEIRTLHAQYMKQWIQSDAERFLAMSLAGVFESRLLPDHRKELVELSKTAGVDEKQTMLANCFLDLSPMTACSTITLDASASPDGVPRFARDLDFPSFGLADNSTVLLIYKPQGKYAFASIAWPGLIGVLSGMNEHGLVLCNMEVTRSQRLPTAMPYTLLYRTVLEQCKTVDEAIALLRSTPRQTENNLMLMDAAGNRAVAELYPNRVDIRRATPSELLISTNHRRCNLPDVEGRCDRYDGLDRAAHQQFGQIGVPQLKTMLAGAAQGDMTLQSMIFEPSTRTLYLATGKNAPTRSFERIELAPLLK